MQNNIFKKRISKKDKIKIIAICAVILIIIGYVIWDVIYGGPLMHLFNNKDAIVEWIKNSQFLGPLVFIFLQILQMVLAPIPGQVISGVGGYVFGFFWGTIWSIIGTVVGGFIVFWISRKLGQPLIEKIIKKETLKKFDFVLCDNSSVILFLIFLIPGLPDDLICYLAGLTKLSLKRLTLLLAIGHLPSIAVANYIGAGLSEENLLSVIVVSLITVVIFVIALIKREPIIKCIKNIKN